MSAADYVVRTAYEVEDRASGKLGTMSKMFDGIASGADRVAGLMDSVASKMASLATAGVAIGGALAMAGIKKGLFDVNATMEDTRIGFATLFNMFGASSSFEGGLGMAKDLVEKIRQDAKELPGEFQDFVAMAQTLTSPMLQAGKSIEDIRNLTRDTVVSAAALKMPFEQASREMAMLLEGRAGAHNVLGMRLGITKDTQVKGTGFNNASEADRIQFITEKLSKAKESLPALAKSWSGLTSTMVDGIKALLGRATLPLFERIKETIGKTNDLLSSDRAGRLADAVGEKLVTAYDWIVGRAKWLADNWDVIRDHAQAFAHAVRDGFEKAWPYVEKIGKVLAAQAEDPAGFAKKLVEARVALGAVSAAPGIANAASGIGKMAGLFGGGGGGAAAAAGAGEAAAATAGAGEAAGLGLGLGAAAAAAAALAIALAAVVGAVDVLTIDLSTATGGLRFMGVWAEEVWRDIKQNASTAFGDLKDFVKDVWQAARPLVDVLGVALLGAIDGVLYGLRSLTWPMRMFAKAIVWLVKKIPGYGDVSEGGEPAPAPPTENAPYGPKGGYIAMKAAAAGFAEKQAALDAVKGPLATAHIGKGAVTVNQTNNFTILEAGDPERVARKVATHIDKVIRNPRKAIGFATFLQE